MVREQDAGSADTLASEATDGEHAEHRPIPTWDRYEVLELVGKGGMGEVYKVRDRRLNRVLALKLILGAEPTMTMRLLAEARALARLDHPNICRVYDAGELDGRAYIAIPFVGGDPLHRAARRMSLDDKVSVMADVAAAIHEAHRQDIVHRDLKPANILVERTADGRWFPVVMDFGVARESTIDAGLTRSGAVLGTPAYMSPEQARGETHLVDQRSDVYGLGATLYEVLTGRPLFLEATLTRVIHDEPPSPRSLVSDLPLDLELIVLKCIAKDRAQRYPSARALADDLVRFLEGEPIFGRRPSLGRRLRLVARRHRALLTLAIASLAVIAAIGGLAVVAWRGSRAERAAGAARTAVAEQLGRDTQRMELELDLAYAMPLHDTRPERAGVRAVMQRIAGAQSELGSLGDAAIHEALGRGHLALHEWREAADQLARAIGAGRESPEVRAAHARALGELYREAREQARRSDGADWQETRTADPRRRERRAQELAHRYLQPALADLEQRRPGDDGAALIEARIALYRSDLAAAEQRAIAIAVRSPRSADAHRLAGDAAYAAALDDADHGRYADARRALDRATARYESASEILRSDASLYEASAEAWLLHAEVTFQLGESPRASVDRALELLARAHRADPDDASAYTFETYTLLRVHRTRALRERGDPRALLDRVAWTAERAVELDPLNARAWDALGNAHVARGTYEPPGSADPWWDHALDAFSRALLIDPDDPWVHNDIGVVHRWRAQNLEVTGRDPMPEYKQALRGYERGAMLDPEYLYAWTNLTDTNAAIAAYQDTHGLDPDAALDRAARAAARGLAIDPRFSSILHPMAQVELIRAHAQVAAGADASDALARANRYLDRAESDGAAPFTTHLYRLITQRIEVDARVRQALDPSAALARARQTLTQLGHDAPQYAYTFLEAARLDLAEACWRAHSGVAPALTARALANAEHAIELDDAAEAHVVAAEVCLHIAAHERSHTAVEHGLAHADRARALDARYRDAEVARTALLALRAP